MKAKTSRYKLLDNGYTYEDIKTAGLTVHEVTRFEERYEAKVETAKELLITLRKNSKYRQINLDRAAERVVAIPSLTPHLRKFVLVAVGKKQRRKKRVELMVKKSKELFATERVSGPKHDKGVYCKPTRPCVSCRN